MGNVESLLVFEGLSRYYMASEELEPGHGWNWNFLKTLYHNPSASSLDLAKACIDSYHAFAEGAGTDGLTLVVSLLPSPAAHLPPLLLLPLPFSTPWPGAVLVGVYLHSRQRDSILRL